METQVLEGAFAEVKRRLNALPLRPEVNLRVIVTETLTKNMLPPIPFNPTEFRNGLPLLSRRELPEPITLDLVKSLSEDED